MTEDRKITIRLVVNGIAMPVSIIASEEPYYRNAAKTINTIIATYSQLYADKRTAEEVLTMALMDIALRHEKLRASNDTQVYDDILSSLTKEIETAIKG